MNQVLLYPTGSSESCRYASEILAKSGVSLTDHLTPDITHLLLDIPTKDCSSLKELLRRVPKNVTVIGGNLDLSLCAGYRTLDLLQDPYYLAKNAAITADCALKVAAPLLKSTLLSLLV